jgi:uncharacterized heparinase superfamily protein
MPVAGMATHAAHEVKRRVWGPALPVLVASWRRRGFALQPRARFEVLLSLARALDGAPSPAADGLVQGRLTVGGADWGPLPPPNWAMTEAPPHVQFAAHAFDWADALVAAAVTARDPMVAKRARTLCETALLQWFGSAAHIPMAWEPAVRSARVLACLRAAARLAAAHAHGGDPSGGERRGLRDQLLGMAATAAVDLDLPFAHDDDGWPLLLQRCAIAAAETTFGEGNALVAACSEAERQFAADGSHVEGAPMLHAQALDALLTLRGTRVLAGIQEGRLDAVIERAAAWLAAVRHPGGCLPAFGDTDPDVLGGLPLCRTALVSPDTARPDPTISAWSARHGGTFAVVHTAAPAWPNRPGAAHDDQLALEWSCLDVRVIAGCGIGARPATGERAFERSAAAHATVELPGVPALELWDDNRVGRRGRIAHLRHGKAGPWSFVAAAALWPDGKLAHLRLCALHPRGTLAVADLLRGVDLPPPGVGHLPLAPGVTWDGQRLVTPAGPVRVDATVPLELVTNVRFLHRAPAGEGQELRYPVGAAGPAWIAISAPRAPGLDRALADLDAAWQTLAGAATLS